MLTAICLVWIGAEINAPRWYFISVTASLLIRAVNAYRCATRKKQS